MTQTQSQHAPIAIAGLAHIGIRVHDLDRSVRFYELFGFKKTAGPIGPEPVAIELGTAALTYDQMAEDTNALLDHLKLGQVKVLGWSDGGIIGLILTIHHPEKVAMLAAMGANLQPDAAYPWAVNRTVLDFFDKPFAMPDTKDLGWFD